MKDDKAPVLSVVTVCFNDLPNLTRTVSSLQLQAAGSWEHLVVDGASTDGTVEWYEKAKLPAYKRIVSEPDDGIYSAMNKGLDLARGKYVVFLNAGDTYREDCVVTRIIDRLKERPEWGYARAHVVDADGNRTRGSVGVIPYSRCRHVLGRGTICHQAVVMRTNFLRSLGGFDDNVGNAADYELLLRAAAIERPVTWPEADVSYLVGGVSDVNVYDHLLSRHRARVSALRLGPFRSAIDRAWTSLQRVDVHARKAIKPLLPAKVLERRALL